MKTISTSWVDCSDVWYNKISSANVDSLYRAFEEAKRAITTVANAQDIGSLDIALTFDDIEELNMKRRKLVSFCNGIHYEISQMVDNPFSVKVADTTQAAYDLNPSDFKVKTGTTLWWDNMTSLSALITSTLTDKDLKKDFEKKFSNLDKDIPNGDIKDAIKEVKFWEGEFKKSEECQAVAELCFNQEVRDNWAKMSETERRDVIEDYVNRIGKVLYGADKTTVKYDADGFGYSNPGFLGMGKKIAINQKFFQNPTKNYSVDKVIDTLTHEVRHQYQERAKGCGYGTSKSLKKKWKEPYKNAGDGFKAYYNQEVERDARGFAALSSPEK